MINISIFKPSSKIVFGGIQQYCNTLAQPYGNARIKFWIPSNTLNTVKYWVLRIELVSIQNTVKYPRQPSATVGNHNYGNASGTAGYLRHSYYLFFKRFLQWTRSSNKRWRPQTICSRASILFIQTNPVKIQIYRQLLQYLTVFGLPTSNTEYCQIPPNTIWELAFTKLYVNCS